MTAASQAFPRVDTKLRYCTRCLLPSTKPYIAFDAEGVCNACRAHERKNAAEAGIDWAGRVREFDVLVAKAKAKRAPFFDALVPVSGGKDSISQVHRLLDRDLRILAVNVDYGIKTEIGRRNLACIPAMGANLFIYTPEQPLHRELVRIGFEDFGDPDLMSHCLLHAFPLRVALQFQVPLVLLGENSAFEYGGDRAIAAGNRMTRAWFDKFAANAGRGPAFVAKAYGIPYDRLVNYDFPDALDGSGTDAVFCSYYFHWDSEENLRIARTHGFRSLEGPAEGTYRDYVGIDEKINRVHQYFKVLKFGYGRATDHACEDIRNDRLTREQGKDLVRRHDLQPLGEDYIADFCAFAGIGRDRFLAVIEANRNPEIWQRDNAGNWFIPGHLVG
ncbi:MAG: N-acetyl sugar amidotransferase [Stellaceae bacterium]